MDRRGFLRLGSGLVAGLSLRPQDLFAGPEAPASAAADSLAGGSLPDLVVCKGDPREATRRALEAAGGLARILRPGQVVVIKPNLAFESPPEWGATTHPEVVAGVIEACMAAGARRIFVVDHTIRPSERCFARTGMGAAVAEFPSARLVSLDDEKTYEAVAVPRGKALHEAKVPMVLRKADLWINVPTAKAHTATQASLGLKNLMGLVWDRETFHADLDLNQAVADLATILRPAITVMDAVHILSTGGPSGPGEVHSFGGVVVGCDPVAVDAYTVGLSTWNRQTLRPEDIAYIRHAAEHELGTLRLDSLRILDLA